MVDLTLGDTQRILQTCRKYRLSRAETAYVLATAFWETGRTMKPVREAFWLPETWRRHNLRYYPWYGRGYVQITWQRNYTQAGLKLGKDLTTDPDVVMAPEIAAEILVRGMIEGWFTGKKLSDFITPEKVDYRNARRIINGTDKMDDIARIANEYRIALPREPVSGGKASAIAAAVAAVASALAVFWDKIASLF